MSALGDLLRVVVILDAATARGRDLAFIAAAAARGGATMLQVRAKDLPAADLAALIRRVAAAAPALPVIVNDRLDVALATGAAGCHLGQDDFPLAEAARMAPAGFILGGSAGSADEARAAAGGGAHYLGIGPIRDTAHKADAGAAIGARGFAAVHAAAPHLPAVAVGGVTAADAAALVSAGAAGVAVIGAVLTADSPEASTRELLAAVAAAR